MVGDNGGNNFYFYNPVAVEFGKKEFQMRWGKRALSDNWRLLSMTKNNAKDEDKNSADDEREAIR
ncbi:MAG: hypothetical protein LRY25_01165 [Flavobacterium sp.]|nr:hypothetical protein [Flavobacterium sp.]